MKYAQFVAAILVASISQSQAVIINQTMSQTANSSKQLTNNGPIITDQLPTHIAQKNETSNYTAAVNESKQVGCTRGENDKSPNSVAVAALV